MERTVLCVLLTACLVATCQAKGGKPPKAIKQLNVMCLAWTANGTDLVTIREPIYEVVFEEMDDVCEDLAMQNISGRVPSNPLDGIKMLGKICKYYERKYDEAKVGIPLTGVDNLCTMFKAAEDAGDTDKPARKNMAKLTKLCKAMQNGRPRVDYPSNFTAVFDDLSGFCDVLLASTTDTKMGGKSVNGVAELGAVCDWYVVKYKVIPAPAPMDGLAPICGDFITVREGGSLDDFNYAMEKEFWMVVYMCDLGEEGVLDVFRPNNSDLIEGFMVFCEDFMDGAAEIIQEYGMPNMTTMPDYKKEDGKPGDGKPGDGDDDDEEEKEKDAFFYSPFKIIVYACKWMNKTKTEENPMSLMDGFDDVCVDAMESLEDFYDYLGDDSDDDDDDDDDDDEFDIEEEVEYWQLINTCGALKAGRMGPIENNPNFTDFLVALGGFCDGFFNFEAEAGRIGPIQNNPNYTDFHVALGDFCDGFFNFKSDMTATRSGKKQPGFYIVNTMDDICEWYDEVLDEEGDVLPGLSDVCDDFEDAREALDENGRGGGKFDLFEEMEWEQLVNLCFAEEKGMLDMYRRNANLSDILDDLGDFCENIVAKGEKKMEEPEIDLIGVMEDICEWLEEITEDYGLPQKLRKMEPICDDFWDALEYLDDDDDMGDDDDDDDFELYGKRIFFQLVLVCGSAQAGLFDMYAGNTTLVPVLIDLAMWCDEFMRNSTEEYEAKSIVATPSLDIIEIMEDVCGDLDEALSKDRPNKPLKQLVPICDDFMDVIEGEDGEDDDYEFLMYKEEEFWGLVYICRAEDMGALDMYRTKMNMSDLLDDIAEFCEEFMANVSMANEVAPKKLLEYNIDLPMVLGDVCEWLKYIMEKEIECLMCDDLKMELGPICMDFYDMMEDKDDDDDDDDGDDDKDGDGIDQTKLPEEFWDLVKLCTMEAKGRVEVSNPAYDYVFDDFGDFCDDLLDEVDGWDEGKTEKAKKMIDGVRALGKSCEWYENEDFTEMEKLEDLLEDMEDICSDYEAASLNA